jgi:hypothetical protein
LISAPLHILLDQGFEFGLEMNDHTSTLSQM